MDAETLVDEIIEALESHPDKLWARRAAVQVLTEALAEHATDVESDYGDCSSEVDLASDLQAIEDAAP